MSATGCIYIGFTIDIPTFNQLLYQTDQTTEQKHADARNKIHDRLVREDYTLRSSTMGGDSRLNRLIDEEMDLLYERPTISKVKRLIGLEQSEYDDVEFIQGQQCVYVVEQHKDMKDESSFNKFVSSQSASIDDINDYDVFALSQRFGNILKMRVYTTAPNDY